MFSPTHKRKYFRHRTEHKGNPYINGPRGARLGRSSGSLGSHWGAQVVRWGPTGALKWLAGGRLGRSTGRFVKNNAAVYGSLPYSRVRKPSVQPCTEAFRTAACGSLPYGSFPYRCVRKPSVQLGTEAFRTAVYGRLPYSRVRKHSAQRNTETFRTAPPPALSPT